MLTERLQNLMMDSASIAPLGLFAQDVAEIEKDEGMIFTNSEILKCYWAAADYICDSYIGNAHETPISVEDGWSEEDHQKEVAKWEAARPSEKRRRELEAKFAGV